jgi:fibro-slime domain-containing protein
VRVMAMTHRLAVTFAGALAIVVGVGCAGVKQKTGGPGTGGHGADGGGVDGRTIDGISISDSIGLTCGNGVLDGTEACDDSNTTSGDGCSKLCQIEADFTCPTVGQLCVNTSICGDGIASSQELCDDGNTMSGDGCSADCKTIDPGYVCRVPGRKCTPKCGDGIRIGGEACDDGNTTPGDGCSSNCLIEPGASCTGTPSVCTVSVCGDGKQTGNESCDCGTSLVAPFPTGCTGPNGLFNGDGTGCSKTCTKEPVCPRSTVAGTAQPACATSCGNGNIEPGEACDDGNKDPGDGCSSTCTVEAGFTCMPGLKADTQACQGTTGNTGQCLELPIKYRDYKNESVSGGHPDFFYLGATVATPVSVTGVDGQASPLSFSKRYCVSNSSGPAKKNDSVDRCWDLAKANLDANGKPAFNTARNGGGASALLCNCQFIDWDHDTNGGHVPGYVAATNSPTTGLTYVNGASGHPMYRGPAPIVASAASFGDGSATAKGWWVDNTYSGTHTVGNLELGSLGANQFQFSSQPNSVLGGFFPLDPVGQYPLYGTAPAGPGAVHTVGTEAMLCNLWPYWFSSTTFGAGAGCKSDQYLFPPSLMTTTAAPYTPANWNTALNTMYANGTWYPGVQGWYHDSWFSDEARYLFNFNGAFALQFYGDDDMFIFINGILVIDLGGVHQRLPGSVSVAANGMATIIEGGSLNPTGTAILPCATTTMDPYTMLPFNTLANTDGNGHSNCTNATCDCRTRTVNLGLTMGSTYEIAIFGADRHPTESNYQLTLSGFSTNQSNCGPACGDGVATGGEECDCGNAGVTAMDTVGCAGKNNDNTLYGGCTTSCKYGPYCGDGTTDSPQEECDNGAANGITYTPSADPTACTLACKHAHFCGDGIVDASEGELCDLGPNNGMPHTPCKIDCTINIDF